LRDCFTAQKHLAAEPIAVPMTNLPRLHSLPSNHFPAGHQWRLVRDAAVGSRPVNIAVGKQRDRASKKEWAEIDELSRSSGRVSRH
jgi:hypothetical protein